jgi:purine-binding chemotaxis protein CheW
MSGQLLIVDIGGYTFGAPVEAVAEILATPTVTPIPQTPAAVAGVAMVRGQALTVLTLRPSFGMSDAPVALALRWGGQRGTALVAIDRVDSLWEAPSDPLPDEAWHHLVPPAIAQLVTCGYRFGSDWLWSLAPDLPERLYQSLLSAT